MIGFVSAGHTTRTAVSVILFVWVSISGLERCCFAASATKTETAPTELAVNFVSKIGPRVTFPFHPLYSGPLPLAPLNIARKYDVAVLEKLRQFVPTVLGRGSYEHSDLGWRELRSKLIGVVRAQANKIYELCSGLEIDPRSNEGEFCKSYPRMRTEFHEMLSKLLSEGIQVAHRLERARKPRDYQQLSRMAVQMVEILIEVYSASPIAGYIDWARGRIDRQAFTDYAVVLIASLIRHRFHERVLEIINLLTGIKL